MHLANPVGWLVCSTVLWYSVIFQVRSDYFVIPSETWSSSHLGSSRLETFSAWWIMTYVYTCCTFRVDGVESAPLFISGKTRRMKNDEKTDASDERSCGVTCMCVLHTYYTLALLCFYWVTWRLLMINYTWPLLSSKINNSGTAEGTLDLPTITVISFITASVLY